MFWELCIVLLLCIVEIHTLQGVYTKHWVIYYFREFEDISAYAAFWLLTPSLDRDLSVRLYSVPHRRAAHHHVPEGCVLVLVSILLELTYQSVQMF